MKVKAKEFFVVPRGKMGMSSKENNEVLAVLRAARLRGELPPLQYEYNKHPTLWGKDPLYLHPKSGVDVARTGVRVRTVLRREFGSRFSVKLV